jgi:hypothetical protein
MDRRRTDAETPLHFMFCRRNAMHVCVLTDEREILSLLLGERGFLLPPAIIRAEDIDHFPVIKDNDVFLGWVIAGFYQPLTFPFALLFDLAHRIFREVYLVAAVAEIGREKYFLRHGRSLAEDCGVFNKMSEPLCVRRSFILVLSQRPQQAVSDWPAMRSWMLFALAVGGVVLRVNAAAAANRHDRVDDRTLPSGIRVPDKRIHPVNPSSRVKRRA